MPKNGNKTNYELKKNITDLPEEILLHTFSFLSENKSTLGNLASVSKQMKDVSEDDSLWQHPDAGLIQSDKLSAKDSYRLLASGNHKQQLSTKKTTYDALEAQLIYRFALNHSKPKVALMITGYFNADQEKQIHDSFASYCEQKHSSLCFDEDPCFKEYFYYIRRGLHLYNNHDFKLFGKAIFSPNQYTLPNYADATNHEQILKTFCTLTAIVIISPDPHSELHTMNEISRLSKQQNCPPPFILFAGDRSLYVNKQYFDSNKIDIEYCYRYPNIKIRDDIPSLVKVTDFVCTLWPSIDARLHQLSQTAKKIMPPKSTEEPTVKREESNQTCLVM